MVSPQNPDPTVNPMRAYLDHNATSPLRPEASDAVAKALATGWGNPSSPHAEGRRARGLVDQARHTIAGVLGCEPAEIVFTASATEANHLALHGLLVPTSKERADSPGPAWLVTTGVEHPSLLQAARRMAEDGVIRLSVVPVSADGVLTPDALRAHLGGLADRDGVVDETGMRSPRVLVSVIAGNNETGVLQPIAALANVARAAGALMHVDATQCLGRVPVTLGRGKGAGSGATGEGDWPVDLLTCSSHKVGGPRGAGVLVVRRGLKLRPVLGGGHQERDRRAGTEDTAAIVGFAAALAAATMPASEPASDFTDEVSRVLALRDRLETGVLETIDQVTVIGGGAPRLPNTLTMGFDGCVGEDLLVALDLDGVAASSGSACSSGSLEPSPVLLAMGLGVDQAATVVRFSLGWSSTDAEINLVLRALPAIVARCRQLEFD